MQKLVVIGIVAILLAGLAKITFNSGGFSAFKTSAEAALDTAMGGSDAPGYLSAPQYARSDGASSPRDSINVVRGEAILPEYGAVSLSEAAKHSGETGQISVYIVREDDTLSDIAEMFGVTKNTIIWANDIDVGGAIHEGDRLVILPVSGVKYKIAKGDTIESVAKRFNADAKDISAFNDLPAGKLVIGTEIIIPDGEEAIQPGTRGRILPTLAGYFTNPLLNSKRSQGLHGHNGIDLISPCHCEGATVMAAAVGEVIVSKNNGGYNGGYGNYVVISHGNGTQTLYAHLQRTLVTEGQTVAKGEPIGILGDTGHSTGPHLHFEVRGAKNPF